MDVWRKPIEDAEGYARATAYLVENIEALPGTEQALRNEAIIAKIEQYDTRVTAGCRFARKRKTPLEVLVYLMRMHELKQKDLGSILGCSKPVVSAIMNGKRELTVQQIRTICQKFSLSADALIFGSEATATVTEGSELAHYTIKKSFFKNNFCLGEKCGADLLKSLVQKGRASSDDTQPFALAA